MQHMEGDPFFRDYVKHPTWLELARALLGEDPEPMSVEWFNKPPGTDSPTPPHQDNYYFCLRPPSVLTIWLALDPVDEENGCLRYVAGSHRRGIRPHARSNILGFSQGITDYGDEDRAREVVIRLQPGDAVVHHGDTIHRADPNRSPVRNRRAFAMVVRGASCPARRGRIRPLHGGRQGPASGTWTRPVNTISPPLERTDLDHRIWHEELDEFVPPRVFDVHTHIYRWAFNLDPNKERHRLPDLLGTDVRR